MKKFKNIIKCFFCLLFILIGVTNFLGEFIDSLLMLEDLFISDALKMSSVGFISVGLIISPLFEKFTKKINKKFSGLRKFILSFGIIIISIICSVILVNIYTKNILGYIWSAVITLLFILLYFYIIYLTNNHKYEDKVKNKWYIVLPIVLIVLSIPYFMIKGLIVNSYNNLIKQFNIEFLDTKKIESVELEEKKYFVFDNLKIRNDFKNYEITHEQEEPYKSITFVDRENDKLKGIALTNFDMFKEQYDDILEAIEKNSLYKFHPYANFILSNEINSEQNYYKYLSTNQKLSVFDSLGKIYTSWMFANISLSSVDSFALIEHPLYDISMMTVQSSDKGSIKMIEVIYGENVYTITLFTTKDYNDETLYSLVSTIKIN